MRILYIASNPATAPSLQIEQEVNLLQTKIDEVPSVEPIDLRAYANLRVDELPTIIARVAPDVIHFAAHGKDRSIVLGHSVRGHVRLGGRELANLLKAIAVRPKLVVVNACSSAQFASELSSAADFAIGTSAPITNDGARTMAATLYQRLAMSSSLLAAFEAAETMLQIVDGGTVRAQLFPEEYREQAKRTNLTEPLRILACFPEIDEALAEKAEKPGKDFDETYPYVQFGVAGAPQDSTQLVFFTDEKDFVASKTRSLEESRSWIVENRAIKGEIWIDDWYAYSGDIQWYASVVSAGCRIFSAAAIMSDAIYRYYFEEEWRGNLPPRIEQAVHRAILELKSNDGARRQRQGVAANRTASEASAKARPAGKKSKKAAANGAES
jgi:hypothetical protein